MEEAVTYSTVTFKAANKSTQENQVDMGSIYDELKTEQPAKCITDTSIPEKNRKARRHSPLSLLASVLGVICAILVSALIILSIHFTNAMSDRNNEIMNLTAQNDDFQRQTEELSSQKDDLQRQTQELSRQNDGLNWTLTVIMEYDTFPVKDLCPQKVCKPCDDEWLPFQSHCYHFKRTRQWWSNAREECKRKKADLVVIETQEEQCCCWCCCAWRFVQEFITNQTQIIDINEHFWIGLKTEYLDKGTWADGTNLTVTYWKEENVGNEGDCVRIWPNSNLLANWKKQSCYSPSHYVCEKIALIKQE